LRSKPGPVAPRDDSFRYLNGTPHIPALYACQPGLEILNKVGMAAIREKSMRLTARLIAGAPVARLAREHTGKTEERAGDGFSECPHSYEVCRELLARDVLVDYRPKAGVRLSPHFYNRDERNATSRSRK